MILEIVICCRPCRRLLFDSFCATLEWDEIIQENPENLLNVPYWVTWTGLSGSRLVFHTTSSNVAYTQTSHSKSVCLILLILTPKNYLANNNSFFMALGSHPIQWPYKTFRQFHISDRSSSLLQFSLLTKDEETWENPDKPPSILHITRLPTTQKGFLFLSLAVHT